MDNAHEFTTLKAEVERLKAEIHILRIAATRANKLVDAVMSALLDQATELSDTRQEVNKLIYTHYPHIADTLGQLERILGDPKIVPPGKPPKS